MDTITQGLLGAVTAQLGFRQRIGRDATWVAAAAAVVPDLDIFIVPLMSMTGMEVDSLAQLRYHRGLRNVTAGIDLAKEMFPNAGRIMVAGSSAGGAGAAAFAPFLARKAYGNNKKLTVFNDAGPIAINLN